jgi:hypothetical protein
MAIITKRTETFRRILAIHMIMISSRRQRRRLKNNEIQRKQQQHKKKESSWLGMELEDDYHRTILRSR